MVDKILYGPIELLPPIPVSKAILEISGINTPKQPYTTYVVLDDVHSDAVERLIESHYYAGCFSDTDISGGTIQLDITQSLNKALEIRPNFNISFLTIYDDEHAGSGFGFRELHLHKTPGMDTKPVTHTLTPELFFKEGPRTW